MDEVPEGAKFLSLWLDQSVVGTNPRDGSPTPPFLSMQVMCTPETEVNARALLSWVMRRYGWSGEVTEAYVSDEDRRREGACAR